MAEKRVWAMFIKGLGARLMSQRVRLATKEFIIKTLARQTTPVALDVLREYNRSPDPELKALAVYALEECEWWNEV